MRKASKIIMTCAVTGSIHTPSMSRHLPITPDEIAMHLAERGIFAWSGHFYAVEVIARLGLEEAGGLLRVGICHYSTEAEVDALIDGLGELIRR